MKRIWIWCKSMVKSLWFGSWGHLSTPHENGVFKSKLAWRHLWMTPLWHLSNCYFCLRRLQSVSWILVFPNYSTFDYTGSWTFFSNHTLWLQDFWFIMKKPLPNNLRAFITCFNWIWQYSILDIGNTNGFGQS